MLGCGSAAERVVDEAYRRWFGLSDTARGQIAEPRSWLVWTVGGTGPDLLPVPDRTDLTDRTDLKDLKEPNCTELADRARRSLRVRRSRPTTPQQHDGLARAVRHACAEQDVELLVSLLSPDAAAFFDGGGKVRALTRPVHGGRQVARSLLALVGRPPGTTLTAQPVNGRTGLVARYDHKVAAVISFDVADGHVALVWVVLNPDKLQSWNLPTAAPNP
nr:RNA polymerase subunit sigma [Streptomyces sp. TS71-3]